MDKPNEPKSPQRVTEVVPELEYAANKRKLEEIEGQDVTITKAKILPSDFGGDYVLFECVIPDEPIFFVTSSAQNVVLMAEKLLERDAFPVVAQFVKASTHKGRKVWTIR